MWHEGVPSLHDSYPLARRDPKIGRQNEADEQVEPHQGRDDGWEKGKSRQGEDHFGA